ncbi:response regulator [Bernardetia sp. OM2101]|uniref:response regulator n=1 Tax=Bernardetia sp. OM2101 TaxID=3344876 RepID=UPI0035CEB66A
MIQGLYFTSNSIQLENKEEITWLELTPPINNSDIYYHDFVAEKSFIDTKVFIIECELNDEQKGLSFATHLRFEGFKQPIYLVGRLSKDNLRSGNPNSLLNTKLIHYEDIGDIDDLSIDYTNTTDLKIRTAIEDGLIIISKPETTTNHTISNEWGAFKLAQYTNTLYAVNNNTLVKEKAKTLYFKYLCLKDNVDFSATQSDEPIKIDCEDKNVLLIDDQADKGWEDIFKIILDTNNFTSVPISFLGSGKDENKIFTDAENLISTNEYDVVLLDLRLKSSDKSNTAGFNDITNFSGYQLLKKIKEKNKGIQVVIFTASNKAWNMKALLETGADGYYIKQSPDFNYGNDYAKQNFEAFHEEMKIALERSSFLKWFWKHTDELINHLDSEYSHESIDDNFVESVKLSLNYAYDTIENYHSYVSDNQKFLNYAFISYCNLIEFVVVGLFDVHDTDEQDPSRSYYLKKINNEAPQIEIITNVNQPPNTPSYETLLMFEKKQTDPNDKSIILQHPYYKLQTNKSEQTIKNFEDRNSLKILAGYAAILLLRYNLFSHQDIQDYETLKEKRHKFMHSNENQPNNISLTDCKNMFRMVYAVLKGEKI